MATKGVNVEKMLRDNLGKEVADAMLGKIDKMVKAGAKPAAIEKMVQADLLNHVEQAVVTTVLAKIGPIQPIKVKPIQVSIKPAIRPIIVSPKINTGVSVKIGPPMIGKGSK